MPYFNANDGDYPYRPRKQADPMFRAVREDAERRAAQLLDERDAAPAAADIEAA
jgi:hypothetical protein